MKNQSKNESKSKYGNLGFYLVLALCAAMIGVSCWFAYTQTADDLTIRLDSALDSANDMAAAVPETNVPKLETEPVMTTARAAVYVPAATTETRETQTVVTTAQEAAAVMKPETQTETVTETTAAPAPVLPLQGEVIGAFSNGELVKSSTTGVWQTHNGVDIGASLGDEVRAMGSGVVDAVEDDPLWGVCITIDHRNGITSRYCNLNAGLTVNIGDEVTGGMVIGAVGDTADIESSMETHLHFEVKQGDVYLDPMAYISGQ